MLNTTRGKNVSVPRPPVRFTGNGLPEFNAVLSKKTTILSRSSNEAKRRVSYSFRIIILSLLVIILAVIAAMLALKNGYWDVDQLPTWANTIIKL